jgi:hypothetical protein
MRPARATNGCLPAFRASRSGATTERAVGTTGHCTSDGRALALDKVRLEIRRGLELQDARLNAAAGVKSLPAIAPNGSLAAENR